MTEQLSAQCLCTKEKIKAATLALIASEGLPKVTIRKIAAQAQVNIAAINYHFGCKEQVIDEVLTGLHHEIKKAFAPLSDERLTAVVRLQRFIDAYVRNILHYPDSVINFIHKTINNSDICGGYQQFLANEGVPQVQQVVQEVTGVDPETAAILTIQLFGAMAFPAIIGQKSRQVFRLQLERIEVQQRYAQTLFNKIIAAHAVQL
ncbi:MAG: TetR/AcrR family transcriptional regulator [Enterobacteriaceae bacterium]